MLRSSLVVFPHQVNLRVPPDETSLLVVVAAESVEFSDFFSQPEKPSNTRANKKNAVLFIVTSITQYGIFLEPRVPDTPEHRTIIL
jgi:hypothetical protein